VARAAARPEPRGPEALAAGGGNASLPDIKVVVAAPSKESRLCCENVDPRTTRGSNIMLGPSGSASSAEEEFAEVLKVLLHIGYQHNSRLMPPRLINIHCPSVLNESELGLHVNSSCERHSPRYLLLMPPFFNARGSELCPNGLAVKSIAQRTKMCWLL